MSSNPSVSPEGSRPSSCPSRIERAFAWLVAIAILLVAVFLWDLANVVLTTGGHGLPASVFRLVVGLGFTFAIWRGHTWARVALAGLCVLVLWANFPSLLLLPPMIEQRHFGDIGTVVLISVVYVAIAAIALFNRRVASLASYRQEEQDMRA